MHLGLSDKVLLSKNGNDVLTLQVDGQGIDEHFGDIKTTANYYVTDHLGTVVNGVAVGEKKVVGAFGESLGLLPEFEESSVAVNYGYTGRELDLESGCFFNFFHFFD